LTVASGRILVKIQQSVFSKPLDQKKKNFFSFGLPLITSPNLTKIGVVDVFFIQNRVDLTWNDPNARREDQCVLDRKSVGRESAKVFDQYRQRIDKLNDSNISGVSPILVLCMSQIILLAYTDTCRYFNSLEVLWLCILKILLLFGVLLHLWLCTVYIAGFFHESRF